MARIVSGRQEQENPGISFMQGFQGSRQQRQEQEEQNLRQMRLMFQMQEAQVEHAREQAKTQALLNKQAEMGDMRALQELSLRQQISPDQKQAESALGILQRIKDPENRKEAASMMKEVIGAQKQAERVQVAGQAIKRAAANGDINEMEWMTRLQSGEEPDALMKELAVAEQEKTLEGMAKGYSQQAMERAQGLIQALPEGSPERHAAEYALQNFSQSPYDQAKPGAAQQMLKAVQGAVLDVERQAQEGQAFRDQFAQLGPIMQDYEQRRTFQQSMKSGEASPLGVPSEMQRNRPMQGEGWTGHPRDWPGTSGEEEPDLAALEQGIAGVWQDYGDANAVVDFAKEQGLDVEDPNVQALIRNALEAVTSADRR
jgi:hypothetical protein